MNLLIYGENLYDKSHFKDDFINKYGNSSDYRFFYLDNIDLNQLSTEVVSYDMFQQNKCIVLKKIESDEKNINIAKIDSIIADSINPNNSILIDWDGKLNKEIQKTYIFKNFEKKIFNNPANKNEEIKWIQSLAVSYDFDLDYNAAKYLSDINDWDSLSIFNEIKKLSVIFNSDQKSNNLGVNDIKNHISSPRHRYKIFALVDDLIMLREQKALFQLKEFVASGAGFSYLISMIARQIRIIASAKSRIEEGQNMTEINKSLGLPSYVFNLTIQLAKQISFARIKNLSDILLEHDLKFKTSTIPEEDLIYAMASKILNN